MHFCQDELMALLTAFPVVKSIWVWIKTQAASFNWSRPRFIARQLESYDKARRSKGRS